MQIIQSGPSSATLRQQALDQALGNVVQGYAAYDKQEKDKLLTLRQQALQDAELNLKLQAQGIDASAKDLMDYSQGNYKPKEISPAHDLAEGLQGPVKPAVIGNANPLLNYTEAKKLQMKKDQEKLDLETESKQAELKYKTAQTADLEAQSPFKAERSQLELERLRSQIAEDKQMSPIKKRSALLDIDKKMGEIENQPFQQQKLIAEAAELNTRATPTAASKLSKMNSETQGKVGSIASGIRALNGLNDSISKGVSPKYIDANTPIIGGAISDNSFTANQRVLDEVIGRLQSGGAIGETEVKTFRSLGPRPGDSPSIQAKKLQDQKSFLMNKLTAFGLQESDLGEMGFDIGGSSQAKTITPPPPGTDSAFEAWKKAKGHI